MNPFEGAGGMIVITPKTVLEHDDVECALEKQQDAEWDPLVLP